jgi:hypothetical protein
MTNATTTTGKNNEIEEEASVDRILRNLEEEIGKLKLKLLKQELNEKLLSFKAHYDNKRIYFPNGTTTNNLTHHRRHPFSFSSNNENTNYNFKSLTSALYIRVYGQIELWQILLVLILVWFLTRNYIITIYMRLCL